MQFGPSYTSRPGTLHFTMVYSISDGGQDKKQLYTRLLRSKVLQAFLVRHIMVVFYKQGAPCSVPLMSREVRSRVIGYIKAHRTFHACMWVQLFPSILPLSSLRCRSAERSPNNQSTSAKRNSSCSGQKPNHCCHPQTSVSLEKFLI